MGSKIKECLVKELGNFGIGKLGNWVYAASGHKMQFPNFPIPKFTNLYK
jgi:hypothetical protein